MTIHRTFFRESLDRMDAAAPTKDPRFLDLPPLPDETHYDDPDDDPNPDCDPIPLPCPVCEGTLDGIIDDDGRCNGCGHVAFDV